MGRTSSTRFRLGMASGNSFGGLLTLARRSAKKVARWFCKSGEHRRR
jgi:hypothetical protein